jgi:hypothetical protein
MEYLYCQNCGKHTGHKRALGWGTFFGAILTLGILILAIPFYPKRCIVCGRKSSGGEAHIQHTGSYLTSDPELPYNSYEQKNDTKKCPVCAEIIKLEAIKCRFCGEMFDPAEVARQVTEFKSKDSFENRVLCSDGNCIGVIGYDGRCKVCGKPHTIDGREVYNEKDESSFENRVLCKDGNCIGVIGPDGRCKVCGMSYEK